MEAIENDEELYQNILEGIKEEYDLQDKILLQDWTNSSHPVMVVSAEQDNFGAIIDINASGALLFGYEKYELVSQHLSMLLPKELGKDLVSLFGQNVDKETYVMAHKSCYLLRIDLKSQTYNSMETGMAFVVHMSYNQLEKTGFIMMCKDTTRILGMTSSLVSLASL